MEKYNMKKIITLLMLMFIVSISFAQYTPMTAAGYQFKRILCDSTLHIPSFCGIPTLRNSTAKNGAIAMDTCNYKIYMWTNAGGWGEIIGAGTDTTSLSLRIDQRVKYTDTASMLSKYLRIIDTTNKFVANVTKVNDSTIRVFKGNTITDLKILGKGTDTTSLSTRIDARVKYTDTAAMLLPYLRKIDTTAMLSKYLRKTDTASLSNRINLKVNISDTATMLSKYLRKTDTTNRFVNAVTKVNDSTIRVFKGSTSTDIELPRGSGGGGSGTVTNVGTGYGLSGGPITSTGTIIVDSATLSTKYLRRADTSNLVATKSNLTLKLNISDTATMLSKYLRKTDTASLSNRINLKVNISDTATMLSKYLRKTDTASLSDRINLKLNITDTTNKFVNNVTKINDSTIRVWKGTSSTDLLIRGNASGGGSGTVTNVATGYGLSGGPITNSGTLIVDTATLSGKYIQGTGTRNFVPKFLNNRIIGNSNIADSSSVIYFTNNSMQFDFPSSVSRITSTQKINLQSQVSSGDRVIIGTIGGNSGTTTNEVVGELGDLSTTSGTKVNTLLKGRLLHSSGTQEVTFLNIVPNFNQSGTPTTTTRGIYYNPSFSTAYTGKNIAFQSTSGDIILNKLKTSSSTSDSIAIFINDTLKKAPYPSGVATPTGYYGAFQDNTSQTAASINTAYPVKFNTTDLTNGVSVVNDGSSNPTRVTLANTGIYNIQFSLQLEKTGGSGNMIADIWIRKNGVDIPTTTGKVVLTGSANASPIVAAWNYVLDLAAGDYVQLMWATSNTNVEIVAAGATSPHPAIPSSILTVTQQSGIMAGTGITAINSLTGAAQIIVAGTSGTDFAVSSTGTTHTLNLPDASASNRGALTSANWTTFNNKIGAADTSVFQRKNISANTIMANNTNAAANVTAQAFYDIGEQAMTNTITFTGTAPTTLTSANYSWSQIGKTVTVSFNALYTTPGTTITSLFFNLPSDMPAPLVPTGWTGASAYLYNGSAAVFTTSILQNNIIASSFLRRNAANSAFELGYNGASATARGFKFTLTYKAQ